MNEAPNHSGVEKVIRSIATVIILLIAVVFAFVIYLRIVPPRILLDADEGFKRAKQTIAPEPLRQWALNSIKQYHATNGTTEIPASQIPSSLRNLYSDLPEDATVEGDSIVVCWGGPFFHWVIQIGDTNFFQPLNSANRGYPHNFKWVSGIYYTREADWKLQ